MTRLKIALQFLTILPVRLKQMPSPRQNAESLLFYPLVGLMVGGILLILAGCLHALPSLVLAVLVLTIWIWLTGGLHLDGLADTADAWVGGFGNAERTLQIMKDPACGPIGVLSLVVILLVKLSALYLLFELQHFLFLLVVPVLGRLVPLFLFLSTPYVRKTGLGSALTTHLPKSWGWFVLLLGGMTVLYFGWAGCLALIISLLALLYLRWQFIRRIGGITGDTVGAAIEIIETLAILSFALATFYIGQ